MECPDDAEVSFVEADDTRGLVAVGEHNDGTVGESDVQVGVARVDLLQRGVVLALQAGDREASRGQIGNEAAPGFAAEALAE